MKLRQTCRVTEKFTSLTQSSWKWNASVDESAVFWRWMNEIDSFRFDLERHSLKTWRRVRRFLDLGAAEAGGRGQKIRTTLVQWQRNWFQMNRQRFHDWISFIRRPKGECIRPSHDDAVGWWGPYSLISADIQRMLQLCKDRIHFPLAKTDGNKRPSVPLVFVCPLNRRSWCTRQTNASNERMQPLWSSPRSVIIAAFTSVCAPPCATAFK